MVSPFDAVTVGVRSDCGQALWERERTTVTFTEATGGS